MRYILFILLVFSVTNCYYDSEEFLFPQAAGNDCDTIAISYSMSIKPLMEDYCLGCHSNSTAAQLGGSIKLEDYSDVKLRVDDGRFLGSIRHETAFSPMPKNGSKLDECSINIVRIWIEKEAPNN